MRFCFGARGDFCARKLDYCTDFALNVFWLLAEILAVNLLLRFDFRSFFGEKANKNVSVNPATKIKFDQPRACYAKSNFIRRVCVRQNLKDLLNLAARRRLNLGFRTFKSSEFSQNRRTKSALAIKISAKALRLGFYDLFAAA